MAHEVIDARWLAPNIRWMIVRALPVVRHCGAGQFVIVRVAADGERIPLTIARADREEGTILLIVQAVGATTRRICALEKGDTLADVAGPLGRKTELRDFGHVVVIGGGVGTAVIYPQAAALKAHGNHVCAIVGGRSKPLVILEDELSQVCDEVYPCTDDGSYGVGGLVTDALRTMLSPGRRQIDAVFVAGPVGMMRGRRADAGAWRAHRRVVESDHGGRDGDVRRVPRSRRRTNALRLCGRA